MTTPEPVAHVLAAEYDAHDLEGLWRQMTRYEEHMDRIGGRHVVVYTSLRDPHRVFVTIGIRHRGPLEAVLRSPEVFDWFDAAGVDDLPPLFAGEVVEKIRLCRIHEDPHAEHAGVVVGAIVPIPDVEALRREVHRGRDSFHDAGVRKVWIYRALDNGHEAMILQDIDTEENALRWIDHPVAARWMASAGVGVYPPLFVGRIARRLDLTGTQQGV